MKKKNVETLAKMLHLKRVTLQKSVSHADARDMRLQHNLGKIRLRQVCMQNQDEEGKCQKVQTSAPASKATVALYF